MEGLENCQKLLSRLIQQGRLPVEEWRQALDNDDLAGTVFLDFSKAFDMVDHSVLIRKLERYGVMGSELMWFRGYLDERQQSVKIGDVLSSWFLVRCGVPQGFILGPLLFILYVNDPPSVVEYSRVRMFADDTTLTVVKRVKDDLEECLRKDMIRVSEWVECNRLKLNVDKTQFLVLCRRRRVKELADVAVELNGSPLIRSTEVKCLGVLLDDMLTWKAQINSLKRKAYGGLRKLKRLHNVLPPAIKKKLYNAMVLPHLEYCSVVWQECAVELRSMLERVQNYGMRLILSNPPDSQ